MYLGNGVTVTLPTTGGRALQTQKPAKYFCQDTDTETSRICSQGRTETGTEISECCGKLKEENGQAVIVAEGDAVIETS